MVLAALAVHGWPGPLPARGGGVWVISTVNPAGASRADARVGIRAALCAAIAQSCGIDAGRVTLAGGAGSAPLVLIDGVAGTAGISISHAGARSVAAFNPAGAVGIDLIEVADVAQMADWRHVAGDYLGEAVAARLAGIADGQRARAFAQAWCEREAHLKLLGLALSEWTALPRCRLRALALPPAFAAALAL